jgi:hypothetical protein
MSDLADLAAATIFPSGRSAQVGSTELVREHVSSVNAMGQQLRKKLSAMDLATAQPVLEALKRNPTVSGTPNNK